MSSVDLILKDIDDPYVRENFKRILDYFRNDTLRRGQWKFFEITFLDGGTNIRRPHGLGFMPKDIIITAVSNSEAVTFNHDLISSTHFDITVSGACTVRFFAGTYRENQ